MTKDSLRKRNHQLPPKLGSLPHARLQGVNGVDDIALLQPVLHNLKGIANRMCGAIGRVLNREEGAKVLF